MGATETADQAVESADVPVDAPVEQHRCPACESLVALENVQDVGRVHNGHSLRDVTLGCQACGVTTRATFRLSFLRVWKPFGRPKVIAREASAPDPEAVRKALSGPMLSLGGIPVPAPPSTRSARRRSA